MNDKFNVTVGRTIEIERIFQILNRKTKNNPILIGEAGVGKTTIIEAFVKQLCEKENNNITVLELNLNKLIAGSACRGSLEERIEAILQELVANKDNVILFIDELQTLMTSGNSADNDSSYFTNVFKPYLARGEIKLIGTATISDYRKMVEKDSALERRLQPIMIEEPTTTEAETILEGSKEVYEKFHNVKINDDVISLCVSLSTKYIHERFLPDKAFDVLDEACARVKLKNATTVTKEDVADVVSQITNIDTKTLSTDEIERLFKMEECLKEKIRGQDDAIETVAKAIRRWRSGITDPKKPIGCFMFLGPTGVGKTELCKALAEYLFGKEENLIKLDMSEYSNDHDVAKLIGSSVGLIFSNEGGILTNKIRKRPYSIVLLDEIEKAHRNIYNIFLQIMQDGILTDGKNKTANFRNSIIIFTSNVGSKSILDVDKSSLGFNVKNDEKEIKEDMDKMVKKAMSDEFSPEFINRLDKIVIFDKLNESTLLEIVDIKIKKLSERVKVEIELSDKAKEAIIKWEMNPQYGARPLVRSISENLETPISEMILRKEISMNEIDKKIFIDYKDEKFTFEVLEKKVENINVGKD